MSPHNADDELLERVRVMEASKFWRVRNAWHRAKARLHLSNGALPPFEAPPKPVPHPDPAYEVWLTRNAVRPIDAVRMREAVPLLRAQPKISVAMAAYETPEPFLRGAIESVVHQAYPNWELCIADDGSSDPRVLDIAREYAARDERIRVTACSTNGHISRALNAALATATGEFVLFLDHDDLLSADALYELAVAIIREPDVDVVYSDEDKLDDIGRRMYPHFKPDWCPESFLSRMYVGHFLACRRALVEEIGGFRPGFEGSQDYDLLLRLAERTERIRHIPKVLYHWRMHPASTAVDTNVKPYAAIAAERALNEALERRGEPGTIRAIDDAPGTFSVRFAIAERKRVSVVIPTRDHGDDVRRCVESLVATSDYPDLEIVLLDNGSVDPESLSTFEALAAREPRLRVVRYDVPFNFSRINNFAVTHTTGSYLLFLNNDTEAVSDGWIEAMVEQAQRPAIGAVGALQLYPDRSVQHAGVILGLGGVAGHSHRYYPYGSPGYYHMLRAVNNYSAVTAACMMVRRAVFDEIGGFDETFAVAFNDVDFCLRLLEAGYRNVSLPHAVLLHFESKSRGVDTSPERSARFQSEVERMQRRWPRLQQPDPCYNPNLSLNREDYSIALYA